jgi:hypothetical protein
LRTRIRRTITGLFDACCSMPRLECEHQRGHQSPR